jgi:hypothetical protein
MGVLLKSWKTLLPMPVCLQAVSHALSNRFSLPVPAAFGNTQGRALPSRIRLSQCASMTALTLGFYLLRAVRELPLNIVKHANARSPRVSLARGDNQIRGEVADDGVGLKSADLSFHVSRGGKFGLFSIGERLHHPDGRFEIVSEPGRGTKVILLPPRRVLGFQGADTSPLRITFAGNVLPATIPLFPVVSSLPLST